MDKAKKQKQTLYYNNIIIDDNIYVKNILSICHVSAKIATRSQNSEQNI